MLRFVERERDRGGGLVITGSSTESREEEGGGGEEKKKKKKKRKKRFCRNFYFERSRSCKNVCAMVGIEESKYYEFRIAYFAFDPTCL